MSSNEKKSGAGQSNAPAVSSEEKAESAQDRILDLLLDRIFAYSLVALFVVLGAILEWLRSYFNAPPQPMLWTMLALIAIAVAIWKVAPCLRELKAMNSSPAGEERAGQFSFACPDCERQVQASADKAGLIIQCPHCGKPQSVPARKG